MQMLDVFISNNVNIGRYIPDKQRLVEASVISENVKGS